MSERPVQTRRIRRRKKSAFQSAIREMNPLRPEPTEAGNLAPIPPEIQALLNQAPRSIRRRFQLWREAIAALDTAPNLSKRATARVWARRLLVTPSTLYGKRDLFRKHGLMALLDKTFLARVIYRRPDNLPALAVAYFQQLAADGPRSAKAAIQVLRDQLRRWQAGDPTAAIPGYDRPPAGEKPPGWSARNLARLLIARTLPFAPRRVTRKLEITECLQGDRLVWTIRQTFPKPGTEAAALAIRRERSSP